MVLGGVFVIMSAFLSAGNLISANITGAAIGSATESSFIFVLALMFFMMGLIFMSNLEKKTSKWVKAAAIAGTVGVLGTPVYFAAKEKSSGKIEDYIGISDKVEVTSHYKTTQGKFERTYRWDRILDEIEEKHKIPQGVLKGLAMRESYGDPLRLNESNDGGAGLFMFQPRTARHYGLKVYGNSNKSGADKKHGHELKELVKENNYDYGKLTQIDERFDVKKAAEAAAKYLKEDYKKYGSWDKALSAYNQGRPAPNASETKHVKAINSYTEYYNQRDAKDKAYYAKLDSLKKSQSKSYLKKSKKIEKSKKIKENRIK